MEMGIRAHPEMDAWKCIKSMFMAWHAEFTTIWLLLGFALYFLIQIYLICMHDGSYGYKEEGYYTYMLILNVAILVSVVFSAIFIIFYCISESIKRTLDHVDYLFKVIMIAVITSVLLTAEMAPFPVQFIELTLLEIFLVIVVVFFLIMLVLIQFESLKTLSWWLTFAFLAIIFFIDFFFITNHEQVKNFWIPFIIAISLLAVAGLFVFFTFPQRLC